VHDVEWGNQELAKRSSRADLSEDEYLPDDTRLWAAMQAVSGGTWGGCVFDLPAVLEKLQR
jgi:hypothetical protein